MVETLAEMWMREAPADGRREVVLPVSRPRPAEEIIFRDVYAETYRYWLGAGDRIAEQYGRGDSLITTTTAVELAYDSAYRDLARQTERIGSWATTIDRRWQAQTIATVKRVLRVDLTTWFREFNREAPAYRAFRQFDSVRTVQAAIVQNVELIRGISDLMRQRIKALLVQAYREGWTQRKLAIEIRKRTRIPAARSARIAKDQTAKLNAAIEEEMQRALGVRQYVWRTQMDERVRVLHQHREGKRYNWSQPPRANATDGHPGIPPGCRCWAEPVITRATQRRQARGERG